MDKVFFNTCSTYLYRIKKIVVDSKKCWDVKILLSCYLLFSDDFLGVPNPNVNNQEAGPLKKYDETVRSGKLKLDRHQRQIVEHLQRLYNDVVSYKPTSGGFFSKVCYFKLNEMNGF